MTDTSRIDSVLASALDFLRWNLAHDRTADSYPARFLLRADLEDEVRRCDGGIVEAVVAVLFSRGYLREPNGMGGAYVEATGRVFDPQTIAAPVPADPFDGLRALARELSKNRRQVVEEIADAGGRLAYSDADALFIFDHRSAFKLAQRQLRKLGWKLTQERGAYCAAPIPPRG